LGSGAISIGLESYGKDRYYAEKGQKTCECCGIGTALNVFHRKTCGDISEWKQVKSRHLFPGAVEKMQLFRITGQ